MSIYLFPNDINWPFLLGTKKKFIFLKIKKKKAKHKIQLTTGKRVSWEMYGLGTKVGHFHYEQEAAYIP